MNDNKNATKLSDEVRIAECEPTDKWVDTNHERGPSRGRTFGQIARHWGDKVADKDMEMGE